MKLTDNLTFNYLLDNEQYFRENKEYIKDLTVKIFDLNKVYITFKYRYYYFRITDNTKNLFIECANKILVYSILNEGTQIHIEKLTADINEKFLDLLIEKLQQDIEMNIDKKIETKIKEINDKKRELKELKKQKNNRG